MTQIKRLFIFDLDDTLGPKNPQFPAITPENANYLRELASSSENILCIATSRPKSLTIKGLNHGGIKKEELGSIFPIGVYEDGFFVQTNNDVVYNAAEATDPLFKQLRDVFFNQETIDFFKEKGFFLVSGKDITLENNRFQAKPFGKSDYEPFEVPENLTVIQGQDNDVKQVYRSVKGFLDDDLNQQKPVFEKIGRLIKEVLDKRFPNWRDIAGLVVWKDAIDLYPRLGEDLYLKGKGLEIALSKFEIPEDIQVYVCGDGKNDITMVEWAAKRFKNYQIICPSNIQDDLRDFLLQKGYKYTILEQNCTKFCEGLKKLVL